jgi:HK97 family phage portal protein
VSRLRNVVRAVLGTDRDHSIEQMLGADGRMARSASVSLPTQDTALRNSIWWACLQLRANVISTFPLDVFRPREGLGIPVNSPGRFFSEPAPGLDRTEYLFGTSIDLDRYGNSIDIIAGRNSYGKITEIQPVVMGADVRAVIENNRIVKWRIGHDEYNPEDIWHQKQFTIKGLPLGLNTLAYAQYTMGIYSSAQQFALDWFGQGPMPRGILKSNKQDNISAQARSAAKDSFKAATMNGEIFVTGREWEWTPAAADQATPDFLAQQAESARDVCRFLGVPASMVDVEVSTGNITYANITQANLQWLITQIGPGVTRMERSWTTYTTPGPWYVKFNTDALLRMDPQTRSTVLLAQLAGKARTPTEIRALDNLPPYTAEDMAELESFAQLGKAAPVAPAERTSA